MGNGILLYNIPKAIFYLLKGIYPKGRPREAQNRADGRPSLPQKSHAHASSFTCNPNCLQLNSNYPLISRITHKTVSTWVACIKYSCAVLQALAAIGHSS